MVISDTQEKNIEIKFKAKIWRAGNSRVITVPSDIAELLGEKEFTYKVTKKEVEEDDGGKFQ